MDGKAAGLVGLADTLKANVREVMMEIRRMGIETAMVTGDNARAAEAIAREAGIERVLAEVLPENKAQEVKKLQEQGKIVAMVGDGINDAPAGRRRYRDWQRHGYSHGDGGYYPDQR